MKTLLIIDSQKGGAPIVLSGRRTAGSPSMGGEAHGRKEEAPT